MLQFADVQVPVTTPGGNYQGTALFKTQVNNAQVALRGLNLPAYQDGTAFHYRGPTIVQITQVSAIGTGVTFTFNYNFEETPSYYMTGSIDFLVIADTQ